MEDRRLEPDLIVAGPIARKFTQTQLVLWLVSSAPLKGHIQLTFPNATAVDITLDPQVCSTTQVGQKAFINLLNIPLDSELQDGDTLYYDLWLQHQNQRQNLTHWLPDVVYPGEPSPSLQLKTQLSDVLFGSCRKPHYPGKDGLLRADKLVGDYFDACSSDKGANTGNAAATRPDMLLMTGDQIYADDVAGPMLQAIHQVIDLLGLFPETLEGSLVDSSEALYQHAFNYYQRTQLLPELAANDALERRFFKGKRKPIFTTVNGQNHLITLAEIIAMYLLVWSPSLWRHIKFAPQAIPEAFSAEFQRELPYIEDFRDGLGQVRRALAHIPCYMIFDDHDITDDWNLTRGWEQAAYGHPYSRRIIGNALIGYWLCQATGNAPEHFTPLKADQHFTPEGVIDQDGLINTLLSWERWHYHLHTSPKLVVLDTRTRRWRSESNANKPSGLMDWESLCELQQELIGQESVIMVSAAPIYGVKLIEAIQKIFTFFGKALTVDAENWMAHRGTAAVILNIFRHHKTPPDFIILSGDVHYSFMYDVSLKFRRTSPSIHQITCSGIKNEFPASLITWLDKLNRVLYARRSPLNWFTKRRFMSIRVRKPQGLPGRQLVNASCIGRLQLPPKGTDIKVTLLTNSGKDIQFEPDPDADPI